MQTELPRPRPVEKLMHAFAQHTHLGGPPSTQLRYLWTDAFALCNYLSLHHETGDESFIQAAVQLVDGVHHTLGRYRSNDERSGWLSGFSEEEGCKQPTIAGLRIGKPLRERGPDDRFDERLEWERDGQYFHYLTKWMHALDQFARRTGQVHYNTWACDLAAAAYRGFVYQTNGQTAMYWKMSIDLSRPLVPSMGQHDPLDGLITFQQLLETAETLGVSRTDLPAYIEKFTSLCGHMNFVTSDPLGIGGLLADAYRLVQLQFGDPASKQELLLSLLAAALAGLRFVTGTKIFYQPAQSRLAFRELGLAIGLAAAEKLETGPHVSDKRTVEAFRGLKPFFPLRSHITDFWQAPDSQATPYWQEHENINTVMLGTALLPESFLSLSRAPNTPAS